MARNTFGGSAADFLFSATSAGLIRLTSGTLTFWDAEAGGTQHTDLIWGGTPATVIPVSTDGQVPTFEGPDGVTQMWADAGGGRVLMVSMAGVAETATAARDDAAASASIAQAAKTALEAVEATNDGIMAPLLADPESLSGKALSATYALKGEVAVDVVTSPQLVRIIAAESGTTPVLADGDMAVFFNRPGNLYYTDFSSLDVGVPPAGWSQPWHTEPTWQVVPVAGATGGKVLMVDPAAAPGAGKWSLLSWDALAADADADVELLVRLRTTQSDTYPMALIGRGSGDSTTFTGARLGLHGSTSLQSTQFRAGAHFTGAAATVTSPALSWFYYRMRLEGDTQMIRYWKEGTPEPEAWGVLTTNTNLDDPGYIGFLMHQSNVARWEIDWVAAATAGRQAVPL